jgi:hypothetical protein
LKWWVVTLKEEQDALDEGRKTHRRISGLESGGLCHHPNPKGQFVDNPMTRGKPARYFENLLN